MTGIVFALAATFVAALPATGVAATPTIDWTQVSTQGPSARESAYMSYDSSRGKIVLFGGYEPAGSGKVDSDTWEFDGTSWTQIPVSGPPPGALGQMVFDSARGVSVLFGGGNNSTFLAPITWEWDGATWVARSVAPRSCGRSSNPGAEDLQHLDADGAPLFLRVADMSERANRHGNVGLVVGATAPSAVADVRKASKLPFLIPGIGTQGGDVSASVRAAWNGDPASCLISVSRAILFDHNPSRAAAGIRAEINAVIGKIV